MATERDFSDDRGEDPRQDPQGDAELAAGDFSRWMHGMQQALRGERAAEVPCGTCTACCRSSQFVHIGPEETDTIAHIPPDLLFPAPRLARGHVLLGYDEKGHCPMLIDDQCSIYEHRPRTCRTYDCRVFPAAGLEPDDDGKVLITQQIRRWRFDFPTDADRRAYDATRAAAAFIDEFPELLVEADVPATRTQHAVLAIKAHDAFLAPDPPENPLPPADHGQ